MSDLIMPEEVKLTQVSLESSNKLILDKVSLNLRAGQVHIFFGKNGAGKSSLNKIIGILQPPSSGSIHWDSSPVFIDGKYSYPEEVLRRSIGFMWQKPIFTTGSLYKNIELPLIFQKIPKETRRKLIDSKLKEFNLTELASLSPKKLSGGEKQRSCFLRAVIHEPRILILDEPFSSLDEETSDWFVQHINQLKNEGLIIIVTTHDALISRQIGDVIHVISEGELLESGIPPDIFESPSHPRTKQLFGLK